MDKENIENKQNNKAVSSKNTKSEYSIKRVTDNYEKSNSYQVNFDQFNKAKKYKFYFECLWILYAMIEDRTSSFFYHIGFLSANKRSIIKKENIKADIREIFDMEPNKNDYMLSKLKGKITRMQKLILWCKEKHETLSDYQTALIEALQTVADSREFNETLDYLASEWRDKRNQLTHALFNKNPDAVSAELCPLVEQGYNAARQLDTAVKQIKPKNIRSKFKLQ